MNASYRQAAERAQAGDWPGAWALLRPNAAELGQDPALAAAWLTLLAGDPSHPPAPELTQIAEAHVGQPLLLALVGRIAVRALESGQEVGAVESIARALERGAALTAEAELGSELYAHGSALHLGAGRYDEAATTAEVGLRRFPAQGNLHYGLALAEKWRGRYDVALEHFLAAQAALGRDEPSSWNIAICATGAGQAEAALTAWRSLGYEAELGPDRRPRVPGLPDVGLRPGPNGPWLWARAISPCHAEVTSVPPAGSGVHYGDRVLFDAQPVAQLSLRGRSVPQFPILGVLERSTARTLAFAGAQPEPGAFLALNRALPDAVWVHVAREDPRQVCPVCLRDGGPHHLDHLPRLEERDHLGEGQLIIEDELTEAEGRALFEAEVRRAGLTIRWAPG